MTTTLWERFHQLVEVGLRWAGQTPAWESQTATYGPPASPASGIALNGAAKALVHISPREQAHCRTFRLFIPTYELDTNYVVTIEGMEISTPAVGKVNETLTAIATAINAHPTINQVVEASAYDIGTQSIAVRGLTPADFDLIVSSGAGEFVAASDATSCVAKIWMLADVPADANGYGQQWVLANQGRFEVGAGGAVERVDTAGFDRLYVEIADADGLVRVAVGPGVLE